MTTLFKFTYFLCRRAYFHHPNGFLFMSCLIRLNWLGILWQKNVLVERLKISVKKCSPNVLLSSAVVISISEKYNSTNRKADLLEQKNIQWTWEQFTFVVFPHYPVAAQYRPRFAFPSKQLKPTQHGVNPSPQDQPYGKHIGICIGCCCWGWYTGFIRKRCCWETPNLPKAP